MSKWDGIYDPFSIAQLAEEEKHPYAHSKMCFINLHSRRARISNDDFLTPTRVLHDRAETEWYVKYRGGKKKLRKIRAADQLADYMKRRETGTPRPS